MIKSRLFAGLVVLVWSSPLVLAEEIETLPTVEVKAPSATGPAFSPLLPVTTPTDAPARALATMPATTPASAPATMPATQTLAPMVPMQAAPACPTGTPIAGAAVYILSPYFGGDPAFITTTGIGTSSPTQTTTDFSWNYNATPAFWLGWLNPSGLGARGHYFFFDQTSRTATASLNASQAASASIAPPANLVSPAGSPSFGSPGVILGSGLGQDNLAFQSNLRLQAIDMEVSQLITGNRLFALFSGGARYFHMSQDYRATLNNTLPPPAGASESQFLQFGHNFTGAGPTFDVVAGYQIGGLPLYFFGDVRGSFLVGSTRTSRNFILNVNDPNGIVGGNQFANPTADARRGATLPIVEVELGLQFEPTFLGRPFQVRGGAVNQTYFGAGSASQTSGNMSLFGGQLSVGMLY